MCKQILEPNSVFILTTMYISYILGSHKVAQLRKECSLEQELVSKLEEVLIWGDINIFT